jgi:mutator protein MutT
MSRVPDDQELPRDPVHHRSVTRTIVVTAAVVCRDGCYLVTRRQQGVHLEGFWEFPGGKCDGGEPLDVCLARELREELDVEARVGAEIHAVTHRYDDRDVELHFFECELTRDARPAAAARSGHALGAARGSANAPVPARRCGTDTDADQSGLNRFESIACPPSKEPQSAQSPRRKRVHSLAFFAFFFFVFFVIVVVPDLFSRPRGARTAGP